jgi:hypothetical protein
MIFADIDIGHFGDAATVVRLTNEAKALRAQANTARAFPGGTTKADALDAQALVLEKQAYSVGQQDAATAAAKEVAIASRAPKGTSTQDVREWVEKQRTILVVGGLAVAGALGWTYFRKRRTR